MSFHSRQRRNAGRMIRRFSSGATVDIVNLSAPAVVAVGVPCQWETLSTQDAAGLPAGSTRIRIAALDLGEFVPNSSAVVSAGDKKYQFLVDSNVGAAGPVGLPSNNPVYYGGIVSSG